KLAGNERAIFNALHATRRHSRESGTPSSASSRASDIDPGFRRGDEYSIESEWITLSQTPRQHRRRGVI
ncbi:MAG TPA: hypothetical protein VL244_10005, partial [Alphaproteobacteria bacterium]|nr:hypothetical protein [Alphaproteobacteria bacterium]